MVADNFRVGSRYPQHFAPSPLEAPSPRRAGLRVVRLVAGWILLLLFGVCLFGSVETTAAPVERCGPVAVLTMFDPSEAPAGRGGECRGEAGDQVLGGIILFGLPGSLLVFGPLMADRRRRAQTRTRPGGPLTR